MKVKCVVVITLFVMACRFASAQTFGFESGALGLYCNYEQLIQLKPYAVWQGVDNLSACGHASNATIVGVSAKLPATGNPAGFSLKGVAYADNLYDAFSYHETGMQWFVITNLKCSTTKYGWIGFASVSGLVFGNNYGFLTCSIPCKGATPTKGLSIGNVKVPSER